MADSIFLKIIAGDIPCHKVFENADILAFLDVAPLSLGHTLVIPKEPAATIDQLSDNSAAALGRVLPRISRAVVRATGAVGFNILQNNGPAAHQAVMHVHFHIIPKFLNKNEGSGLDIRWAAGTLSNDVGHSIAAKIVASID